MQKRKLLILCVLGVVVVSTSIAAVYGWLNYQQQKKQKTIREERTKAVLTLRMALMSHAQENGRYPENLAALEGTDHLPEGFVVPADVAYHAAGVPFRPESTHEDEDAVDKWRTQFDNAILLFEDARDDLYGTVQEGRYLLLDASDPEWLPVRSRPGRSGQMPIHYAASSGNTIFVKRLLERGVDVDTKTDWGSTPLHWAALNAQTEMAILLLANGADVNAATKDGMTPLYSAMTNPNADSDEKAPVVEVLLAAGAEMDIFAAAVYGDVERVSALLEDDPELVNAQGPYEATPLSGATAHGKKDVVEILLAHGADINATDGVGFTAVHGAAFQGHEDVVELLSQRAGDANIFAASALGMTGRVKELLSKDPALARASAGKCKNTPLHNAATLGSPDVMQILLDNGAEIEARDWLDDTPLIVAAQNGRKEAIEFLLANNADINAKSTGRLGNSETALTKSIGRKQFEAARLLIEKGADVDAPKGAHSIPLQEAALQGNAELVKLLLAKGADVNSRSEDGQDALQWASSKEIAEILIAHGANVNAKDQQGKTPLLFAIETGKLHIVNLLLDSGADIDAKDAYEKALREAAYGCHLDIWKLLRRKKGKT